MALEGLSFSNNGDVFSKGVAIPDPLKWGNVQFQETRGPGVVSVSADTTLTAADTGKLYVASAVDLVMTLPATQDHLVFTFVVSTVSATTGLSISPVAADRIQGKGITAADDKDIINTAATDAVGDLIQVVGDGSDGWWITNLLGTWAREA